MDMCIQFFTIEEHRSAVHFLAALRLSATNTIEQNRIEKYFIHPPVGEIQNKNDNNTHQTKQPKYEVK